MADGGGRSRGDGDEQARRWGLAGTGAAAAGERFDLDAWRARVTDRLLVAVAAMGAVVLTISIVQAVDEPGWWSQTAPFMVVYALVLALAPLRGRLDYRIRAWGLLLVGYAAAVIYLAILGLLGNGVVFLLGLPAMGLIILGFRSGVAMALLSGVLYLLFAAAAGTGVMAEWLIIRENSLAVSQWLSQGLSFGLILVALVVMLATFCRAQEEALAETREAAADLARTHGELAASSTELDRYTRLLETVAGISHEISGVLARDELLQRAVSLMTARLDMRAVAVYLVEPASGALMAGPVVGEAVPADAAGELHVPPAVAELVRTNRGQAPHAPEGASQAGGALAEVALPLHVGSQLLGVLYVVSPQGRSLTDREVQSLHGLADQLAVALDNARLFGEVQARLDELNALQRQYTAEAWTRFVGDRPRPAYSWQPVGTPGDAVWQETLDQARGYSGEARGPARLEAGSGEGQGRRERTEKGPVTRFDEETNQHVVAVPVRLREAVIGVLAFHRPRDAGAWRREEISAIEAVGARLAFAAENLRLLEQTQQRAAQEGLVDQITRQMQASLDPETILQVAVREVGRALGASQSLVEIRAPGGAQGREYSGQESSPGA
ncbi:MAG: GAF domain-containing protein [Anaerolineae bacterium]|nr:GAF domain-containing protein [Anaerolineae bacterium]